jgi:hypothetical protein
MKKCRTNAEIANFIIGCSDASQLQDEAIINDEPLDVDRLGLAYVKLSAQ